MPREIVHWTVLHQLMASPELQALPAVHAVLKKYPAFAGLGALTHDAPYYYRFGGSEFEPMANYLHGAHQEDTFDPVRSMSKTILQWDPEMRPMLWAFVIGMMTHMATDIIFHPLVFYFTGNYHHHDADKRRLAQARHRMFEVYLDSWMKANIDYPVPTHLSDLRRQAGEHFAVLPRFLGAALPFGDKPAAASHELWKGSLSALILFQMLFTNDFVGAIFRGLGKTFPRKLAGIDALFSFGRRSPEDFFNGQLEFVNPLDNEKYTASMHELLSAAVQKMLIWLKNLEPLVGGDHSDVDAALGKIQGESLNFGRYRVSAEEMKYFAEAGANLPGLKIPPTESGDSK